MLSVGGLWKISPNTSHQLDTHGCSHMCKQVSEGLTFQVEGCLLTFLATGVWACIGFGKQRLKEPRLGIAWAMPWGLFSSLAHLSQNGKVMNGFLHELVGGDAGRITGSCKPDFAEETLLKAHGDESMTSQMDSCPSRTYNQFKLQFMPGLLPE